MADVTAEARVVNAEGLHARPAAAFVQTAARFACDIHVAKDSFEVNGKSIMGVMMLAAECGSTLNIRANGSDADEAVQALIQLIASGFEVE